MRTTRGWGLIGVALLAAPAALAQDGLDAHGPIPPSTDGDPLDPLLSWRPDGQERGALSVGVIGEYGNQLLVRFSEPEPGRIVSDPLLDDLVGMNLGASYGLSSRAAVAVALPTWIRSSGLDGGQGPALGDLQVWVPVALLLPEGGEGLGVSAVPWVELPTGAAARGLGDAGFGAGALLAGSLTTGPIALTGNAGFERRAWSTFANVTGGPAFRGSAGVGWAAGESLGLHLETTLAQGLRSAEDTTHALPPAVELVASARGRGASGLWWTGGLGTGLTEGVGTAALRLYAGIGFSKPAEGTLQPLAADTSVRVLDPQGRPIRGATIEVGRKPVGTTDADGRLDAGEVSLRRGATVRAEGYLPAEITPDSSGAVEVVLQWAPTAVTVAVRDQNGASVPAGVRVTDVEGNPSDHVVIDGQVALPPGTWGVITSAEGLGTQTREVVIGEGRRRPVAIEALLAPDDGDAVLDLRVTDAEGNPLEGARVLVDGKPFGTTTTGGQVTIDGLADGKHRVEVSSEGFQTVESRDLALSSGAPVDLGIALRRMPGSVKVVAHGPDGKIVDAVVRFDGASRLSPQPLGEYGERIFVLRPGAWQVLVASPTYGMQQREVVVPEDDTSLIVVDVVLQPAEDGQAQLGVRVVDVDGQPVDGAEIVLDGKALGLTSTGGTVELRDLLPGPRELVVRAPHFRETAAVDVLLVEGLQERVVTLGWEAGTVRVSARGPEGPVTDATARFSGEAPLPPLPLGADGVEFTNLPPGAWNVLVASGTYGLQQRQVVIPPDSRSLTSVEVVLSPPEGGRAELAVRVVDPAGNPIPGARVTLDGSPLGATSTGGQLMLGELDTGSRTLAVAAEPYQARSQKVSLKPGTQTVELRLAYAPGTVRVVTRSAEGPVADAVVRFAGPDVRAPLPVDAAGERLVALSPGSWQAVVMSPRYGLAQREVTITANQRDVAEIVFDLAPVGAGEAELLVRVLDADGLPIPGAEVLVGGESRGKASAGGALLLGSLAPGAAPVEVRAPDHKPSKFDVALVEGSQERIVALAFVPVPIEVVVRDESGTMVDAEIRFDGPADVPPGRVGTDGREQFQLRPGKWQVLASTAALGVGRREVTVVKGAKEQLVELVLRPAKVDVTADQVVIREQVQFDFNSAVLTTAAAPVLDEVAATLLAHPELLRIEVQGHTDDLGAVEVNLGLSEQRARAVAAALVSRGVAPERLFAAGYGATRPRVPNDGDEGRAQNRRVQFEIAEIAD